MATTKSKREATILGGANSPYLEVLYEQYLSDPNSVDETWREYFQALPMVGDNGQDVPHSEIREQFLQLTRNGGGARTAAAASVASGMSPQELKQIRVTQLINAYRVRGHQLAKTDPLGSIPDAMVRELRLEQNGLSDADLNTEFQTPSLEGLGAIAAASVMSTCTLTTRRRNCGCSNVLKAPPLRQT